MIDFITKWFLRLWLTMMTIGFVFWFWSRSPLGFILLAVVILFVFRASLNKKWQRQKQGYWVEYLSSGQLRAGEDDFAVVYHEEDKQHFFYGKVNGPRVSEVLNVPSESAWEAHVPEWMSGKRDVILGRIRQEFRWVQIIETEGD